MEQKIKNIITEWFFRLENGYATKPYSENDLKVLEEVLKEYQIPNWKQISNNWKGIQTEDPKNDIEHDDTSEIEREELSADFRNLLDSVETFKEIITRKYFPPGYEVTGLEQLFSKIVEQPKSISDNIRRIIAKKSNRDFTNGTFKMGQYERILYGLIKETIKIPTSSPELLWLLFIFDCEPTKSELNSSLLGNLKSKNGIAYFHKFASDLITLGTINPKLASMLTVIKNISDVFFDSAIDDFSTKSINKVLDELADPENLDQLKSITSKNTKITAIRNLMDKLKNTLENHNLTEFPNTFCSEFNINLSELLSKCPYYGTIVDDMVYIMHSSEVFPQYNATDNNRLNENIISLDNLELIVDGNVINTKLVG